MEKESIMTITTNFEMLQAVLSMELVTNKDLVKLYVELDDTETMIDCDLVGMVDSWAVLYALVNEGGESPRWYNVPLYKGYPISCGCGVPMDERVYGYINYLMDLLETSTSKAKDGARLGIPSQIDPVYTWMVYTEEQPTGIEVQATYTDVKAKLDSKEYSFVWSKGINICLLCGEENKNRDMPCQCEIDILLNYKR